MTYEERHFGLSGISLTGEEVDLGRGVLLKKTYSHLMSHPMFAFTPNEEGKAHPGPWKPPVGFFGGQAGFGHDLLAELYIPEEAKPNDRSESEVAAWIALLLSFCMNTTVTVICCSSVSLSASAMDSSEIRLMPYGHSIPPGHINVSSDHISWIQANWSQSIGLLFDEGLAFAFEALYLSHTVPNYSLRLVMIWAALERIFSAKAPELRFRVSAILASFLEPPGEARYSLFRTILKLYDERSGAAHGSEIKSINSYDETLRLGRRALMKVIEQRHMPSKTELEKMIFIHA